MSPPLRVSAFSASWSTRVVRCCLVVLLALGLGCGPGCRKEFQTVYGQRSGPGATESVNGTVVFAEMFEAAGHHVSSWSSLSPRLDQADCVVWFPDDFQPPSPGVENWFERWLRAKPHRSLIYVGRDFDAAPWYWRKIQPMVPADQQEAIAELRAEAERAFQSARPKQPGQPAAGSRSATTRRPARRATSPAIASGCRTSIRRKWKSNSTAGCRPGRTWRPCWIRSRA